MVAGKPLDKYGEVLMCAPLPFDSWRTRHNTIEATTESIINDCGVIANPEAYGLFSAHIPATAQRGILPSNDGVFAVCELIYTADQKTKRSEKRRLRDFYYQNLPLNYISTTQMYRQVSLEVQQKISVKVKILLKRKLCTL